MISQISEQNRFKKYEVPFDGIKPLQKKRLSSFTNALRSLRHLQWAKRVSLQGRRLICFLPIDANTMKGVFSIGFSPSLVFISRRRDLPMT